MFFTSGLAPDAMAAAGQFSDRLCLLDLQSKMKRDPESYEAELQLVYRQFQSSVELLEQQADFSFKSVSGVAADSSAAKDLGERALFLAHLVLSYPQYLSDFPDRLVNLVGRVATPLSLPPFLISLRFKLTQALILLVNKKVVAMAPVDKTSNNGETLLTLFMKLQTHKDRTLRKLAYSHVIRFIQRMNNKHKDQAKNKSCRDVLIHLLEGEESIAKRSFVVLCDLYRKNIWSDDYTANAICNACFLSSSWIMKAALSFLIDYEKIQDDDDSDASSSEDEGSTRQPQVVLSREDLYKAHHKGTTSSKKKKKAKLKRVIRSMKREQRLSSDKTGPNYNSPLSKLRDAQDFAEKLFSLLQKGKMVFEVRVMALTVIARTIGLHQLVLLKFYPFLVNYVQPHQKEITKILAAAVQACHERVPDYAVQPLFKQIVDKFVHDRSSTEAIAFGLNVVREICLRMPLLMNKDLLQDLVLYKKSNEKAVSSAARSLMTLFREICPSLLIKKDRGRFFDLKTRPKEYGEATIAAGVAGAELLQTNDENDDEDCDLEENCLSSSEEVEKADDVGDDADSVAYYGSEDYAIDEVVTEAESDVEDEDKITVDGEGSEDDVSDADDVEDEGELCSLVEFDDSDLENCGIKKRKFADFDQQLDTATSSLRALKKLAAAKIEKSAETDDRIYSNEEFQLIKKLQAKEKARCALTKHGLLKCSNAKSATFKVPSADQLSLMPVDPAKLEANIRRKLTKEERVEIMLAGREEREKYKSRASVKQKKKGGLSNRQKEHKKIMPIGAKRGKIARSKAEKKRKQRSSGKQFRGKKAWK